MVSQSVVYNVWPALPRSWCGVSKTADMISSPLTGHGDHLTGQVGGQLACQEDHDICDFPHFGWPTKGLLRGQPLELLRGGDFREKGMHRERRRDGVDTYTVCRCLDCGAPGKGHHTRLCRGIV